ncbi:Signal peptide peptidase-like 3 [Cichlidogyrus casuarinus]|uniref:Signal peptide peptidase-like 3 n=1 Tax=Cichlidogyrus casuarinus TaxID=1844966 RepID=A0ABD2PU02_9PLAT
MVISLSCQYYSNFSKWNDLKSQSPTSRALTAIDRNSTEFYNIEFSIFGLGDVVMPGILIAFLLHFDCYKFHKLVLEKNPYFKLESSTNIKSARRIIYRENLKQVASAFKYFPSSLVGYIIGFMLTSYCSKEFHYPQPALLYLVPMTLMPTFTRAYLQKDFRCIWDGSFSLDLEIPVAPNEFQTSLSS